MNLHTATMQQGGVSCNCAAGHILQELAGFLLDPIFRHLQYPGALPYMSFASENSP